MIGSIHADNLLPHLGAASLLKGQTNLSVIPATDSSNTAPLHSLRVFQKERHLNISN